VKAWLVREKDEFGAIVILFAIMIIGSVRIATLALQNNIATYTTIYKRRASNEI
jgi:hypothetical protein